MAFPRSAECNRKGKAKQISTKISENASRKNEMSRRKGVDVGLLGWVWEGEAFQLYTHLSSLCYRFPAGLEKMYDFLLYIK